jgi:hypothetical protein
MAELIDISQFRGVKTHADVEDLSEIIAQNIENLKIVDGQLEKTFAAGSASGIPVFPLTTINTKISSDYSVQNVYTFISDKFNTDEHRYIVAIINSSNVLKLFWYDPSLPNVTDHLQVEDDILLFTTSDDSGLVQGDYVVISDVKDNASPQVAIAGTDNYDTIDYKSGNEHWINTDNASTWGGSFFATAQSSGLRDMAFGGKHGTHLNVDNDASGGISSFTDIALLALNGKVLCMYSYCSGTNIPNRIKFTIGSTSSELNTTLYNQFKGYGTFKVNAMINHSDAIWVYYSALDSGGDGTSYNAVVKYTVQSNGTIVETGFDGHDPSDSDWGDNVGQTFNSGYFYTANTGTLYLLVPGNSNGLFKASSTSINQQSGVPSNTSGYEWKGITSITNTVNGNKEYLIIAESDASNHKLHYIDLNNNLASWASNTYNHQLHQITKMDFGENNNKNESVIVYYERSGGEKYLQYSTHNDASVILGFADINGTIFPTTMPIINKIKHINRNPSGAKYLMVATNSSSASPPVHGALYRIDSSKTVLSATNQNPNTNKEWHPTCVDDVVTGATSGNQFFEHAKGYIVAYGVEWATSASQPRSALNRITDIGWGANTWNGTGTLDYKWTDIISKYNFPEISDANNSSTPTFYHKRDKNPIVVSGDTIRFIPGSIGKVSSNEAKSLWLGYINRSLFNSTYSIPSNWYGYSNVLNNPFRLETKEIYKTSNTIRGGDSVKYNCTAIYDGVQETLFDKKKELVITDSSINDSIVEVQVVINDITAMNKRITGLNIYRSIGTGGIYGSFQLIGHMTFVDTNNDLSSVGTLKEATATFYKNDKIFIKTDANQYDTIRQLDTSEFFGANKHALDADGEFDGIDNIFTGESKLVANWINIGTIRAINNSQTYLIVTTSDTISDSYSYVIDSQEAIVTASPAVVTNQSLDTGIALSYDHDWTTAATTFTVVSDISNIIKTGDTIRIGSNTVDITINSVGTTTFVGTPSAQRNGIGGNVKIRNVRSGDHIVNIQTRGDDTVYGSFTLETSPASHVHGVSLSKKPVNLYLQMDLDDNANFTNRYLDSNGNFVGTSWKIKERLLGNYTTKYQANNGAYGGSSVGFISIHNFSSDFPSGITQNSLSGSIFMYGDNSFEIEGNSAYDSDIGGVWVKTTESVSKSSDLYAEGRLLEGFNISSASGATTPGMGFTRTGNKYTITCRDFRLDDLGSSPTQTIFSNRVNGQFAKIVKSRLFLGNVYLNPEDRAEERQDYVAYSEINQFDTIPVSNVIAFEDREGGAITGLASLFNRLVVFKPQALFILSIPDPTDPTSWEIVESKHNIGNIAPRGIVEVHDSVYFVYHDGIYEISANMAASSTATPSVMNKISADIEDQFMASTNKASIRAIFDPNRQEIVFRWLENTTEKVWAYNYVLKTWRIIDMGSFNLTLLNYDENGSPLNYDIVANQIIKFDTNNASITKWKSKKFPLDLHRKRLIRYMTIQYTGNDAMTANVYLDGETTASFTKTGLSAGTRRFPVKRYANRVELELTSPSSTNPLTIKRLQLEVE